MTGAKPRLLFVGALTHDMLYRAEGFSAGPGKYLPDHVQRMASGMAASAGTAAARLGGDAALWASVGSDPIGADLIDQIAGDGVDCRNVRRVPGGRSASATIIVDETGARWVLVDYDPVTQAAPPACNYPDFSPYDAVMADLRWPDAARAALRAARDAGKLAVLDADVAPRDRLEELASCATHVVASQEGATLLSGTREPRAAVRAIARRYCCFTCVTLGGAGAVWTGAGAGEVHHVPCPSVDVVDTNGAGDVFHGAFTLALAEGAEPVSAIRFASAAAALSCTVLGGRLGAPNRADTLRLMRESYPDDPMVRTAPDAGERDPDPGPDRHDGPTARGGGQDQG